MAAVEETVGVAKGAVTSTLDTATETAIDNLIRTLRIAQLKLEAENLTGVNITAGVNILNTVHMDFQIQPKGNETKDAKSSEKPEKQPV